MNNCRKLSVKIIDDVLTGKAYSNIILRTELNSCDLGDKDKALVTEIVYGTLKYKSSIDRILSRYLTNGIDKLDINLLNILRTAIYQMEYLDKIPSFAAVNESVEMAKEVSIGGSKLVNGVLRSYLRAEAEDIKYYKEGDLIDKLCFLYSFPKFLIKMFISQYGEEIAEKIMQGLNKVPDVTVRVNSLKIEYDDAFDELTKLGYEITEGVLCPEAIKITKGKSIEVNPLFKNGCITVQDESAMLVGNCLDLQEDMVCIDLCSAPGGKTTHMSELMNNTGKVFAFDIHEHKIALIKYNTQRLGIDNVICNVMDASLYNHNLEDKADRVLIDVPCSGLGIIRKKPEIKWNKTNKEMKELVSIQQNIMETSSKYVKKGGYLVYSTCTLNKEENENNIDWFLKKFPQFKLEPIYFGDLDNFIYNNNKLTILPNENMDGFFIAKLKRHW